MGVKIVNKKIINRFISHVQNVNDIPHEQQNFLADNKLLDLWKSCEIISDIKYPYDDFKYRKYRNKSFIKEIKKHHIIF